MSSTSSQASIEVLLEKTPKMGEVCIVLVQAKMMISTPDIHIFLP